MLKMQCMFLLGYFFVIEKENSEIQVLKFHPLKPELIIFVESKR